MNIEAGVSVIVLTYNAAHQLDRLLSTFLENNTCHPIEIIVVDFTSTDKTADIINQYVTRVFIRMIQSDVGLPFSVFADYAVQKAVYPNLLLLCPNIVYTADALPLALEKLSNSDIGAVAISLEGDTKGLSRDIVPFVLFRKANFNTPEGCSFVGVKEIDDCWKFEIQLNKKAFWIDDISLKYDREVSRNKVEIRITQKRKLNCDADSAIDQDKQSITDSCLRPMVASEKPPAIQSHQADRPQTLQILFVLPQPIDSNCGYHAQRLADGLIVHGVECIAAVPKKNYEFQATHDTFEKKYASLVTYTYAEILKNGISFSNGQGPDIIHAWTPREGVRQFVMSLTAKKFCPVVIHLEDNEEYLTETAAESPFAELEKLSPKKLDKIIPTNRYHPIHGRKWLEQVQGLTMIIYTLEKFNFSRIPSLTILPPPDERLFYPRPINRALRDELNIPENHIVLVYCGNVHAGNRGEVLTLYKAVQLLNRRGHPTTLIRTGINAVPICEGDQTWIKDFEKPLGWVSRSELPDIMSAADMFVQPGHPGPFNDYRIPCKLPEYFAMGRPVILPRTNLGLKVENGREGYVLDNVDAEGIAGAVNTISECEIMKRNLSEGAVEFYLHKIYACQSKQLNDFYSKITPLRNRVYTRTSTKRLDKWPSLIRKLDKREKLMVVFINDVGFAHGAGIAMMRQVEVFLSRGHNVLCIAGKNLGHNKQPRHKNFFGLQFVGHLMGSANLSTEEIEEQLFMLITSNNPDLVIAGNFHAVGWPVSLLSKLNDWGFPVVAYAHDLYWAAGVCAHPLYKDCLIKIERCNDSECPKPFNAYPPHKKGQVSGLSKAKIETFGGKNPVPLGANSTWTETEFRRQYGGIDILIDTIPLPINTDIFKPADNRDRVRGSLGLDKDKFIILAGSCSFSTPGKGGILLVEIAQKFLQFKNVQFIFFGNNRGIKFNLSNILPIGFVENVENLVKYYQSSDVFLNPVTIESFGQTMSESLSCGTPVICFPVCGVTDIAIDGETALCPPTGNISAIEQAIHKLIKDPSLRKKLGENGRKRAITLFSTKKNYIHWQDFLRKIDLLKRHDEILHSRELSLVDSARIKDVDLKNIGGLRTKGILKKNNNKSPLITVAIVLFNGIKTIEYTILSILNQKYSNIEFVVIDGESTDGSLEIVKSYNDHIDFWISAQDCGVYDAMNRALDVASGEYIIFMGAGDTFVCNDALSVIMKHNDRSYDVLHGHVYWQSIEGEELLLESSVFAEKFDKMLHGDFSENWLRGLPPHQATLMKTELAKKFRFDLSFTVSADWEMIFRAYSNGAKFQMIDEVISNYPGGGYSATKSAQWILDVLRIVQKYTKNFDAAKKYFLPIYELHKKVGSS